MSDLLQAEKVYSNHGFSVIATTKEKVCVLTGWAPFQKVIPTEREVENMFRNRYATGIAIVCGAVSGGETCLDLDCKYDLTGTLFDDFMQSVVDYSPTLAKDLVIATTQNNGYHLYFLSDNPQGSKVFAKRPLTDEERQSNPHQPHKVLVETRGEGAYFMAPPTPGYKIIQGDILNPPKISEEDEKALYAISESFNQVIEEEYKPKTFNQDEVKFNKSPFDDYNERGDIIGLLKKHGWLEINHRNNKTVFRRPGDTTSKTSGDYHHEKGLFSVFTTSTQFEPKKGYRPASVYTVLECNGDTKEAYRKLLAEGYGEPFKKIPKEVKQFIKKEEEAGVERGQLVESLINEFGYGREEAEKVVGKMEATRKRSSKEFWWWNDDKEKLVISYENFALFLENQGFGLYFYDTRTNAFQLVQNKNNLLDLAITEMVKKATLDYIENYSLDGVEYTKSMLKETIMHNGNIFSNQMYEYLERMNIDFLRDTKDACHIPFMNGIVKITAQTITLLKHGDVHKVIWRNDLIDFEIAINQDDETNSEFSDFVYKVMGQDKQRFLRMISLLGYVMHKYKDPAKPYVLIIAEENNDEKKGGGSGKGILVKGIEKVLNTLTIDGKNFDINKNFAFQRVKLETKLIAIQDANKFFPFEKLYSIVTEGLTVEKKNKDEIFMPYSDSPKILITTNYSVSDEGVHAKRRQQLVEFSSYFTYGHSPADEYGHLLFDDWDKGEWNRFYNFMFYCIQYYLKHDIIKGVESDLYKHKKIKNKCGDDFLMWYLEYSANGCENWKPTQKMHEDFLDSSGVNKNDYSSQKFTKSMYSAAEVFGYTYSIERRIDDADNKRKKMGITEKAKK